MYSIARFHTLCCKNELFFLQVISVFALVEVQLQADGAPLKYSAVLKRPNADTSWVCFFIRDTDG